MRDTLQYVVPVEVREASDGPMLRGVVLQEGRAAHGGRAEVFHAALCRVAVGRDRDPDRASRRGGWARRADTGRRWIASHETRATPAILAAYKTRRYFSVEFHALAEVRTAGGVREIQRALLDAAALVPNPEYPGVRAEVRSRAARPKGVAVIELGIGRASTPRVEVRESYTDTSIVSRLGRCGLGW